MCFVHNDSVNITQWNFQMHVTKMWGENVWQNIIKFMVMFLCDS